MKRRDIRTNVREHFSWEIVPQFSGSRFMLRILYVPVSMINRIFQFSHALNRLFLELPKI